MTPTEQDFIVAQGYGLALDLILADNPHVCPHSLTLLAALEIHEERLTIVTQLLSIIASCRAERDQRHALAQRVLGGIGLEAIERQFSARLNELIPHLALDDNLELLRDIQSATHRAVALPPLERRQSLHHLRTALAALVVE